MGAIEKFIATHPVPLQEGAIDNTLFPQRI